MMFVRLYRRILPAGFRRFMAIVFLGVTPDVPITLFDLSRRGRPLRALTSGLVLGWVFCLGGVTVLTLMHGTFWDAGPMRKSFLEDRANLINYGLLCPVYLGLCGAFIVLVLKAWSRTKRWSVVKESPSAPPRLPVGILLFVALSIAVVVTVRYVQECLDPLVYEQAGWYVDRVVEGERILGAVGIYYTLLNFSLLFVAVLAVLFLIPMLYIAHEVGKSLRARPLEKDLGFDRLRKIMTEFTLAYLCAKLLAAVFILNAFTWKMERPEGSLNFLLMLVLLSTVGIFVVSFPRYYVELEWFQFKVREALFRGKEVPLQSDDLRDRRIRYTAFVLDMFFGFATVLALWGWVIESW